MDKSRYGNRMKMMVMGGCAAAVVVGGSLAYLTATDDATNRFNVEQALTDRVTVIEPNWDEENGEDIVPTQTIPKDPQLVNESDIPVYAIMQISVPYATIETALADGTTQAAAAQDLFTYEVNAGWTEQGSGTLTADGSHMVHTYLLDQQLAAGATSPSVFDAVTLVNAVDGQIDGQSLVIDVKGSAIQAEGFDTPAEAWAAYQNQNQNA